MDSFKQFMYVPLNVLKRARKKGYEEGEDKNLITYIVGETILFSTRNESSSSMRSDQICYRLVTLPVPFSMTQCHTQPLTVLSLYFFKVLFCYYINPSRCKWSRLTIRQRKDFFIRYKWYIIPRPTPVRFFSIISFNS